MASTTHRHTADAIEPANWPGRTYGVRPPAPGEVPLSAAEVIVALQKGIVGGQHSIKLSKQAIAEQADDELLTIKRITRPAGAWRGHKPARAGVWGGLLANPANDGTTRRPA